MTKIKTKETVAIPIGVVNLETYERKVEEYNQFTEDNYQRMVDEVENRLTNEMNWTCFHGYYEGNLFELVCSSLTFLWFPTMCAIHTFKWRTAMEKCFEYIVGLFEICGCGVAKFKGFTTPADVADEFVAAFVDEISNPMCHFTDEECFLKQETERAKYIVDKTLTTKKKVSGGMKPKKYQHVRRTMEFYLSCMNQGWIVNTARLEGKDDLQVLIEREYKKGIGWSDKIRGMKTGIDYEFLRKMNEKNNVKKRKRDYIKEQKKKVARELALKNLHGMSNESLPVFKTISFWLLGFLIFSVLMLMNFAIRNHFIDYPSQIGNTGVWFFLVDTNVEFYTSDSIASFFGILGQPLHVRVVCEVLIWFGMSLTVAYFSTCFLNLFLQLFEKFKVFRRYRIIRNVGPFGDEKKFKHFMDTILLSIGMCDFTKPTNIISLLIMLAREFTDEDSILERMSTEVHKLISSTSTGDKVALANFTDFLKGMSNETEEVENIKAKKMKLLAHWKSFRTSELGMGLAKLILIMVTTGVLPEFNWDIAGIEIYSLTKSSEVIKATDLFEALDRVCTGVAEGVARFEATGKFESIFSDGSLEFRVADAIAKFVHISTGSIEMYEGISEAEYADLVNALHKEVKEKMLNGSKSDKFYFKPYLDRLASISQQMKSLIVNQKMKMMPYSVLLVGNSGTGKSHAAERILQQIMLANDVSPDSDKIITVNSASAYDDEVLNKTRAAIFDDLGNSKPKNSNGRSVSEVVIKYLNNVSQMAYKADVDSKNAVRIDIDFAIGTTNVAHLNTASETNNKASIKRRFKFDITMKVKDIYCIEKSTAMNEHLVHEMWPDSVFPPVHECKLERTLVTDTTKVNGDGYTMELIKPNDTRDWWELHEIVAFLKEDSKKHFAKQKQDLESRKSSSMDMREIDLDIDCNRQRAIEERISRDRKIALPKSFIYSSNSLSQNIEGKKNIGRNQIREMHEQAFYDNLEGHSDERTYQLASDPPQVTFGPEENNGLYMSSDDVHAVLRSSPELIHLVRCGMSWKHYFFITWTPYFIQVIWTRCGCKLSHFLLFLWFTMCPLPMLMIIYGGIRVRSFGFFLIIMIVCFIRDMSLNMLANVMFRSAVDRRTQQMWQVLFDDTATKYYLVKIASVIILVAMARKFFSLSQISYHGQALDDEKHVGNSSSAYNRQQNFIANTAMGKTMNMTDQQIINAIQNNCVTVYAYKGDGQESLRNTGGFFIGPKILVVPRHFALKSKEQSRFGIETSNRCFNVTIDWRKDDVSAQYVDFEDDLVAISLTGICNFANVVHLFCKRKQECNIPMAKAVFRKPGGKLQIQNAMDLTPTRLNYKVDNMRFVANGYHGETELEMHDGSCMTVVIKESPSPEILGFHLAGSAGKKLTVVHAVTQKMLEDAIQNLTKVSQRVNHLGDDTLDNLEGHSTQVHPLCPSRMFDSSLPVEIMGSVPGSGPRTMKTEFTPFHDEIAEFFGGVGKYGIPKGKAKRIEGVVHSPWKKCVEDISKSRDMIPFSKMSRAARLIVEHFGTGIAQYIEDGNLDRKLSLDEATNGIPGMNGVNGVNINTAAGLGFGKTKKHHVSNDEHPWRWNENVIKKVEEFEAKLLSGVRPKNILNASLKDEPLKAQKCEEYATRVFFCDSLDALLVCMKYFTASCNFMSLYNGRSHCALGLNATSYDWDWLYRFLKRDDEENPIPDSDFICLDFKSFDKVLPESLMYWSWWILIEITRNFSGFSEEDRDLMKGFAHMKCTPYVAFNGTLLQFNMLHTSGNGCTAHVGSLAGLMLILMVCLDKMEEIGVENDRDVWKILRSIHLGDDCVVSVRKTMLPNFNFITLRDALAKWGIVITPADKEAAPSEYQNVLDYDFLKRSFVWCEERKCMVAPLAKTSFVKGLGFVLPSKVVSKKTQWGATVNTIMFECSFHGREFFEKTQKFLKKLCEAYGIHSKLVEKSYDEFLIDFAVESGRRYPDYKEKDKEVVEKAFREGEYPDQWQMDALGRVVRPCNETEKVVYTGMSSDIAVTINVACCFRKCCRMVAIQHMRDEEGVEDILSSSGSGPDESKNQIAVLDDTVNENAKIIREVLTAIPSGELKTREARILPNG